MGRLSLLAVVRTVSSSLGRLKSISYTNPELTPSNWCEIQPCKKVRIASREITLTQPTSTFLVYALGVLTIGAGFYFLLIRGSEISRIWWGISLLLWGVGALLAGTSYQAFAYEIKCAGRQSCAWTSWWEVVYLMFQQVSMNAMLVAVAYSCTEGSLQLVLLAFALVSAVVYVICTFIGGNCSDQIAYHLQFDGLGLVSNSSDSLCLKRLALLHLPRPYGPFSSGHLDFAAPHQRSVLAL